MPVFEVIGGGDRRSLIKRFERKSKHDAVSELVDFHLLHCSRIERLEAEAQELREEVARGNRITCAMALDIAAVGEVLGIPGEQQEGGTGEFIDIIEEMKATQGAGMTQALLDVQAERRRQVEVKDWPPEHDDEHVCDEIAALACFYAMPPGAREWDASSTGYGDTLGSAMLPDGWLAKTGDRRIELIKAGALIIAEIERLDRAAAQAKGAAHE